MVEPQKPFACSDPECGMSFTNEDHLHVHSKKHDMELQLGFEQKSVFVADQTPTPTRFIRNCEEVGLFQDLNVNPFDEGFKRAIENKHGILCLEAAQAAASSDDVLHTPQVPFPLLEAESTLYSSTNNQRNTTISRSSSDDTGAIKEYETTTISKLTNEVTTTSRVVGKQETDRTPANNDISIVKHKELIVNKDVVNETQSVSFRNNVFKIHEDISLKKDGMIVNNTVSYKDSVIKDSTLIKDGIQNDKVPPIMSQKSLDFVVDSLTAESCQELSAAQEQKDTGVCKIAKKYRKRTKPKKNYEDLKEIEDFEAIIKLPGGKRVKMKAIKEKSPSVETKEMLRESIKKKVEIEIDSKPQNIIIQPQQTVIPINGAIPISQAVPLNGTLIPVQINPIQFAKLPIPSMHSRSDIGKTKKLVDDVESDKTDKCRKILTHAQLSNLAASKRYRERLKMKQDNILNENRRLKDMNQKLMEQKAVLRMIINELLKKYPLSEELRALFEKNS